MKTAYKIALGLTGGLVLWMSLGSGLRSSSEVDSASFVATTEEQARQSVQVLQSVAQPVAPLLMLNGQVIPERVVRLRAETAGKVTSLSQREGDTLETGEKLLQLELGDRVARRLRAESSLAQAQRRFDARNSLHQKGYTSAASLDDARAALKRAEADLLSIELEIAHTTLRAPIDGIIETLAVEVGSYVNLGEEIATIVDNQPLKVVVAIPQHQIAKVYPGQQATVALPGHAPRQGQLRFISPRASDQDRSFRAEIEIANPDHFPAGTSATVEIMLQPRPAHFISPAAILLDDQGRTGIHSVNAQNIVEFHLIDIIRSRSDGLYIGGLPEKLAIISVGTHWVSAGQLVDYPLESAVQ